MDPGAVIFSLVAQAYTQYSALDRLLEESDSNARSQQRSIAGAGRQQLPDAPAHQAAAGRRRQSLPGAAEQRSIAGAGRQQLPDAPAHQAAAGRRR